MNAYAARVYEDIKAKYPWQTEFLQSVAEVFESLGPVLDKEPKYEANKILERMIIPERIIQFQVPWIDDKGEIQVKALCAVISHVDGCPQPRRSAELAGFPRSRG